ncbi:MAG: DinB family protein [Gemmatimonadales bacterium]
MTIADSLLAEFDHEAATTRRLLERVPDGKGPWKPHPKSFPLGHLAQLVATMPGWLVHMLQKPHLDLATYPGYTFETTARLLELFDHSVGDGREAIAGAKDPIFAEPWSLKHGDLALFTLPRMTVVRTHINHFVHHRGQLTVYLRLLDVPIPCIYGPTADEKV